MRRPRSDDFLRQVATDTQRCPSAKAYGMMTRANIERLCDIRHWTIEALTAKGTSQEEVQGRRVHYAIGNARDAQELLHRRRMSILGGDALAGLTPVVIFACVLFVHNKWGIGPSIAAAAAFVVAGNEFMRARRVGREMELRNAERYADEMMRTSSEIQSHSRARSPVN